MKKREKDKGESTLLDIAKISKLHYKIFTSSLIDFTLGTVSNFTFALV